jgi:hypothetical protein
MRVQPSQSEPSRVARDLVPLLQAVDAYNAYTVLGCDRRCDAAVWCMTWEAYRAPKGFHPASNHPELSAF